jgi:hypothetical protein
MRRVLSAGDNIEEEQAADYEHALHIFRTALVAGQARKTPKRI